MTIRIPKRLLILQRLCEHITGITKAAGYHFDLDERSVHRGRNILGAESAVTKERPVAVSVIESPRPDIATYAGDWGEARSEWWTLLIQGQALNDLRDTDLAYFLAADVELHLSRITATRSQTGSAKYPDAFNLGGLITGMEVAPPVVRAPEPQVSATAFFFLPVRVGVAGKTGDPFCSP
jgi:hypothetical protein